MKTRAFPGLASVCAVACLLFTTAAFAQITIDRPARTNGLMRFDSAGGGGPFVIQRANLAGDPWCSILTVAQGSNVVVGGDGPQAFFRVRDLSNAPSTRFTVSLSGANAGNASTADGFGTLEVNGDSLKFDIAFRNLSSGTTLAHIHAPSDATNIAGAGVIIDFASFMIPGFGTTNGRIAGTTTLSLANKTAIFDGKAYVNIHTANFPGGEIRGQVTPTTYRVVLSAAGERPNTTGRGYAFGVLNLIGNQLTYHLTYQNLNSVATAAHIHGRAAMSNTASVLYWFQPTNNYGISGTLSGRTNLTAAQINALVDGRSYANIHTTNYPGGEIRGQVLPYLGELPFTAELTGAAERPTPVVTSATAFVGCGLQSNVLSFFAMYRGLPSAAIAAHFHGPAPASGSTSVVVNLAPFHRGPLSTQGVFAGSATLTPTLISNLLAGDLYMNIHTTNNPNGEIRGQLCPAIIPVALDAAQESPTDTSPATGYGYVGLVGKQFSIGLNYRDLTAVANNAHLHGPAPPGVNTGTLINLNNANYFAGGFGTNGFLIGSEPTSDAIVSYIVDGLTYVNIHTPGVYSGGEIRGQVFVP